QPYHTTFHLHDHSLPLHHHLSTSILFPSSPMPIVLTLRQRFFFSIIIPPPPRSTLFPYTTLFRSSPPHPMTWPERPCSATRGRRSEEHTSELQSRFDLVCRLLLERNNHILHHFLHMLL